MERPNYNHSYEEFSMSTTESTIKVPLAIFAVVVLVWGIMGFLDIGKATQVGYDTDGNNTVTQVYSGGPAEAAGLEVGDFIVSINGHSTEDAEAMFELGRAKVGESRTWVVNRNGTEVSLEITAGPLLPRTKLINYSGSLAGLCFLVFTWLAYLTGPSLSTRVLAFMGTAIGLAFMGGPYIASAELRPLVFTVTQFFVFFGVAALVHFLLLFPTPREFLDKPNAKILLYAPATVFWLLIAYRLVFQPPATSILNTLTNVVAGIVIGGYFIAAIVIMWQNHSHANSEERASRGLNTMLLGTVIGLLPLAVNLVLDIFSPKTVLPGEDYYFLALVLIPITWSMAARRANS
jgi:membrane-associated protease RseP (regulator of RpoE activity)